MRPSGNPPNTSNTGGTLQGPDVPDVGQDVDCDEVKMRYPVESYSDQQKRIKGDPNLAGKKQAHHVLQNSHFCYPRTNALKEICPGYSPDDAPCIPLDDGTDTSTEHGAISKTQKADAKGYRDAYKNNNKSPTYQDARADAKKQLTSKKPPGPGLSDAEAECILLEVDKLFEKASGGKKDFALRPPGSRSKALPKPAVAGNTGAV